MKLLSELSELSEREIAELQRINPILEEALRKVFLKEVGTGYPEIITNELLGQLVRARLQASTFIEQGFREIEKLTKKDEPRKIKVNPAV